ncbi:protein indeterminate-domain 7-like [Dioscorea cayenensis subsp. rotundata]|uniref:Protein EARLY HEADING DATE 2 n=1 Tax=Dioscorea cayennensis subsp. rotundata TaxID=55577 RepID=A0AB40B3K2_DIOCR|nr:protein indeterminate-domain 7-like [Dioscorea cayenensis subsp. rotundata]XP_039121290.1 protein indeterminate-domain 7-like [Dioscorea cayenensis subsp. rotundata]
MIIKGLVEEENVNNMANMSTSDPQPITQSAPAAKKKRNLPGNPDPTAEVIALSPKTLMATNRFICEICNKGFQRDQNLQLHRRGHNLPWKLKQRPNKEVKKKVYICPEISCVHHDPSRALGDLTGIKKHFSRKHGEKKWKCEKCSKKYAVHSDWKAHSKICGTKEYRCDCGTPFSRRDSFITHRAFCDALAEESARSGINNNHHQQQQQHQLLLLSQPAASSSSTLEITTNQFHGIQELNPWSLMNHIEMISASAASPSPSPSPHLSATALLQKAAQMGATMSSTRTQSQMASLSSSSSIGGGGEKVVNNGGDGMTRDFLGLRAISMHSDMLSLSGLDSCMNSSYQNV